MNPGIKYEELKSESTEIRLQAARYFAQYAVREDIDRLRAALARESVPWIKRALRIALDRASGFGSRVEETSTSEVATDGIDQRALYARAVEEVAGTIIHEFAPIVGLMRVWTPRDVGHAYENSHSRRLLDQLLAILSGVRSLKRAAAAPKITKFLVSELVDEIVASQAAEHGIDIKVVGSQRLLVSADKDQLSIVLSNGLRNALEATAQVTHDYKPPVVISWGSTANENYIVIRDFGPGFVSDPQAALKIGSTTKAGHAGFGLALAKQAMFAMSGELELKNADDAGAHFEVRWFRENE